MPTDLHIEDRWGEALTAGGLDAFEALMIGEQGECVSKHDRGDTYRIELPCGEAVFLKRDRYTSLKDILIDLSHFRRPESPCTVELAGIRRVQALGIPAPEPLAWGWQRRWNLPWRAVLVTRPLPGTPLSELLKSDPPRKLRLTAMRAAGEVAGKLYRAGLSWADLAPKHFFIPDDPGDGLPGVLDLARMRPVRCPRSFYLPKQLRRFCARLRACGGTEADEAAFLEALNAQLERGGR